MNVLAFDIETVPDVDAGRRLYGLEGLSDDQVGRAMFHLRHQESGSDFLRHPLHRVVAISVALRAGERFTLWSLGDLDSPERDLVQRFFDGIDRSRLWIAASPLSPRETECLHWAARGMSDKEIARRIGRSADTVSFHIKAAIRKLDAVNRTHAVALAVRAALIEPTDPQPPFAVPDPMG